MERIETAHPRFGLIEMGRFDEERSYQNWRGRGTNDWLLIATLDGGGRFGHADGVWVSQTGDLTLLRPGTRHDYGTADCGRWNLLWAHFHPRSHWREWLEWPEIASGLMNLPLAKSAARDEIIGHLKSALQYKNGAIPRRDAFAMNVMELAFLLCDAQNPKTQMARLDTRVQKAMDYLCLHAAETVSLPQLADVCGLSVSRLAHLFRKQTGQTLMQYLERQKLERARQLLELTARPAQTIAAELGFESAFYFSARFKRHTGFSPRDYRKNAGEQNEAKEWGGATGL